MTAVFVEMVVKKTAALLVPAVAAPPAGKRPKPDCPGTGTG